MAGLPGDKVYTAIHGISATQVWVGSSLGNIYAFNGSVWALAATLSGEIRGLYVAPEGAVVATTPTAVYRCSAGCDTTLAAFNTVASPIQTDVRGVCGRGSNEIYAAAYHQTGNSMILGWNGSIFAQLSYTSNAREISACAVLPSGRAVFVGLQDVLTWRPDAGSGTEYAPMNALGPEAFSQQWYGVAANPIDGGAVAVGKSRRAALRGGSGTWTLTFDPQPSDGGLKFRAATASPRGEVWAGGDPSGGQVLAFDIGGGFQFTSQPAVGLRTFALWAADDSTLFVAGELADAGVVYKATR